MNKSAKNKIEVMLLLVVAMIAITFVIALTDEERQGLELEKAQLEAELSDAGYGKQQEKTMFAGEVDKELNLNINNLFIYINLEFNYEIE